MRLAAAILCILGGLIFCLLWWISVPPRPADDDPELLAWLMGYGNTDLTGIKIKVRNLSRAQLTSLLLNLSDPEIPWSRHWVWAGRLGAVSLLFGAWLLIGG